MESSSYLFFMAVIIIIFLIALYYIPFGIWFAATISGVRISITELILMRIRKSPVKEIVEGLIASAKGGLGLNKDELEAFGLSGGNIRNVVNGMIAAKSAGLNLSFKNATKADSQGIDILKAVQKKLDEQQDKEVKFE